MGTSFGSLSALDRSVVLGELLRRRPELTAEAEEITASLLDTGDSNQHIDEIAAKLHGQPPDEQLSVLQPYLTTSNVVLGRMRVSRLASSAATSCSA